MTFWLEAVQVVSFDVKGLEAQGEFLHRNTTTPFRMLTHLTYDQHYQNELSSMWRYFFEAEDSVIEVHANQQAESDNIQVEVSLRLPRSVEANSPSDDHAPYTASSFSNVPAQLVSWDVMGTSSLNDQLASLNLESSELGVIEGLLRIAATAKDVEAEDCQQIIAKTLLLSSQPNLECEFKVSGSWQSPRFTLSKDVSNHLLSAIQQHLSDRVASSNAEALRKTEKTLRQEVEDTLSLVQIVVDSAEPTLTRNRKELATISGSLQRNLDSMTGAAFNREDYLGEPIR